MALVQVSKTSERKHKPPLGFRGMVEANGGLAPELLMTAPNPHSNVVFSRGVFEVYVYYRKLKSVDAREWAADRRWWMPPHAGA